MKAAGLNMLRAARVMRARAKAAGTNAPATGLILSIFKAVKDQLMGFVGNMTGVLSYTAIASYLGPDGLKSAA